MKIKFLEFQDPEDAVPVRGIEIFEDQAFFFSAGFSEVRIGDRDWKLNDTIQLPNDGLTGALKPAVFVKDNKQTALLLLGSGKGEDNNGGILFNIKARTSESVDLSVFYDRIRQAGIPDLDLNSATLLNDKIVFSNSTGIEAGSESRLIFTSGDFWKKQGNSDIFKAKVEWEQLAGLNPIITAITYSYENDWLIVAAVAMRPVGEGESGGAKDAYLGIIENAYRKSDRKRIRVNEAIKLTDVDPIFEKQVIESISIHADKEKKLKLHLVSSDEAGAGYLMKVRLKES